MYMYMYMYAYLYVYVFVYVYIHVHTVPPCPHHWNCLFGDTLCGVWNTPAGEMAAGDVSPVWTLWVRALHWARQFFCSFVAYKPLFSQRPKRTLTPRSRPSSCGGWVWCQCPSSRATMTAKILRMSWHINVFRTTGLFVVGIHPSSSDSK